MNDPLAVVGMLGHRLLSESTGGRDMKALLMVVGMSDTPAQDLAAALGVPEDIIEAAYAEVRSKRITALGQAAADKARLAKGVASAS